MTIQTSQASTINASTSYTNTSASIQSSATKTSSTTDSAVTTTTSSTTSTSTLTNEEALYDLNDDGTLSISEEAAYLKAKELTEANSSEEAELEALSGMMDKMKSESISIQTELQNKETELTPDQSEENSTTSATQKQETIALTASKAYQQFKNPTEAVPLLNATL